MVSKQISTTDGLDWWGGPQEVQEDPPQDPPQDPPEPTKGNVRGIHGGAGMAAPPAHLWGFWISELKAMNIAWYKLLDAGDPNDRGPTSTFAWASRLKQEGIEPIVRFYVHEQFPDGLVNTTFAKVRQYADVGVTLFEIGNEPNLTYEWKASFQKHLSWQDPFFPERLLTTWLWDAERVILAGGKPGFYALAPTDWGDHRPHPTLSSVMFYDRIFRGANAVPSLRRRFLEVFNSGAWLAVHNSPYEFDFNQNPKPAGGPPCDMCMRGYEIPYNLIKTLFGLSPLTISTEGGVFCMDSSSMGGHKRLRSHEEHAQRTKAMYSWVQKNGPLAGICSWLLCNEWDLIGHHDPAWSGDAWYRTNGALPVVEILKQR